MSLFLFSLITWLLSRRPLGSLQIRTAPEPPPQESHADEQWENEKPPHIPPRPDATRKVRDLKARTHNENEMVLIDPRGRTMWAL